MALQTQSRKSAEAEPRAAVRRRVPDTRSVFWILAALLAALPTVTLPVEGPWLAVKAFVLEVVAIIVAVLVFSRGEWTRERVVTALTRPVNLAVIAFVACIAVSAAMSTAAVWARGEAMRHLGGALLYFGVLYGLSSRRNLSHAVWLLAAVGSLGAVAAFLNAREGEAERIAGAFHNQQLLAGFLCVLLPLVLIASQRETEVWPRSGLQAALVIMGAGLLVTQNRSAWLATAAALMVMVALHFLWGRDRGEPLRAEQFIVPALVVLLTLGLFVGMSRMTGSLSQRAGTLSSLARDDSFRWRLAMWDKAARMLRDRPLTGWGLGSFPLQQALYPHPDVPYRTQLDIAENGRSLDENAHNTFLQLAAETGYPGLILYLGIFATFGFTAVRELTRMRPGFRQGVVIGAVGGAVAHLVSAFGSPAWEFAECSAFLWVVLALGMLAAGVASYEVKEAKESGIGSA